VRQVAWRDSIYRFSHFKEGRITYVVGRSNKQKFNYNLFSGEMDFITDRGDTLTVTDEQDLRLVMIDGHVFYHDHKRGYIEILLQLPLALGVQKIFYPARKETVADDGYGVTSHTTSSARSYIGPPNHLTNEDNIYKKESKFYFLDQKNKVFPANKFTIVRMFPDNKKEIKAYYRENNIDFKNQSDLIRLVKFCNRFY
jgi:hypothetical protein